MLKLTIASTIKSIFGTYEIAVKINGKSYRYELYSKYAYDLMMAHYKAGRHGRYLAMLNKFKD